MNVLKKIFTIVSGLIFFHALPLHALENDCSSPSSDTSTTSTILRSIAAKKIKPKKLLTSSQVSSLFNALSATTSTAGADAITLLTTLADGANNLTGAIINIVSALTTQDVNHSNTTPLDAATTAVKTVLATTNIPSKYGTNTLLHYAALYDVLTPSIDSTVDAPAAARTIITSLLTRLTASQQLTAITARDQWNSTPLHYAALSPDEEATVMTALLSGMTQSNRITTILSAKNTWGYTAAHYAANSSNKAIIDPLFHNATPAQRLAALTIKDQWGTTPLHYAALSGNTAIIDPLFLTGITTAQMFAAITTKNTWDSNVIHYAGFSEDTSIIDPLFTNMTPVQRVTAISSTNQWGYTPIDIASRNQLRTSIGIAEKLLDLLIPTPSAELATIVWPSVLGV